MRPAAPRPRVVLEVIAGPHAGDRVEFDEHDTLLVGRGSAARLRLANDPHFSRHHFLIEVNPPDVLLRDLGSRNGTRVNDRDVRLCRLAPGDVIAGGLTRIRFTLHDAADDVPTADLPDPAASSGSAETRGWEPAADADHDPGPTGPLLALPGYTVLSQLGRGGMGVVYLARHDATGERVAVKVVIPESTAGDRAVNQFVREARVLSRLDHPRIVRFRELGLDRGRIFFAMEYVETTDPKARLDGLPAADRIGGYCGLLCQVLEGVQYAHEQGVVHRDLKPANVLVAAGGRGRLRAKVADFGLAKNYENAGLSGMTHDGQALGTLPFMAPEQIVSARTARPAVDVYAAGVTLYYQLAGKYPHDFPAGRDPLRVILEEPPVPLARRVPDVPPPLAGAVHRCLEKAARDRFPSAAALRQALLPFVAGPVEE